MITDAGFKDFREDAHCTIKPSALIGERYLSCEITQPRPDGAALPARSRRSRAASYEGQHLLPVDQTSVPVDPDLLLASANKSVRERFTLIIRELGAGVAGRGDKIAATLRRSNEALIYGNRVLAQLAEQTEMLQKLDRSADTTLASLNSERDSISGLVQNGNVVARRLAARPGRVPADDRRLRGSAGGGRPDRQELQHARRSAGADHPRPQPQLEGSRDDPRSAASAASRGEKALDTLSPTFQQARRVVTSTDMDAFIERFGKTSASARTTASVLGAALGDFRTTGGIDYFLDAIYGLAYSVNARDSRGYVLRTKVQGDASCAVQASSKSDACGDSFTVLENNGKGLSGKNSAAASRAKGAAASTKTPSTGATSTEAKAADLLLGGGR